MKRRNNGKWINLPYLQHFIINIIHSPNKICICYNNPNPRLGIPETPLLALLHPLLHLCNPIIPLFPSRVFWTYNKKRVATKPNYIAQMIVYTKIQWTRALYIVWHCILTDILYIQSKMKIKYSPPTLWQLSATSFAVVFVKIRYNV